MRSTEWHPPVSTITSRSSTNPGLTPVPSTETPFSFASASISAASAGLCASGSAISSAIEMQLMPAPRTLRRSGSCCRAHDVVARVTTSTRSLSSTTSGSFATATPKRRPTPSTSPRSRPAYSGRPSTAATIDRPGFSSMSRAMPLPMAPTPH